MTIALVGTEGAVAQGTTNTALSVFYGSGETPSNNKLGVLVVCGTGTNTFPTTPTGWTLVGQDQSTNASVSVYQRETQNGDATNPAVSIGALASTTYTGWMALFSGAATSSPLDQVKTNNGTASPLTATATGADTAAGELVIAAGFCRRTGAATATTSITLNNGATNHDQNNDATSAATHYRFTWGITTGNSGADATTFTTNQTTIQGIALVLASFKVATAVVTGSASLDTTGTVSSGGFKFALRSASLDSTADVEVTDFEFPPVIGEMFTAQTADTSLSSDAGSRLLTEARVCSDTSATSDAVIRRIADARVFSDTSLTTDAVTRHFVNVHAYTEMSATIDALLVTAGVFTDTSLTRDAVTALILGALIYADAQSGIVKLAGHIIDRHRFKLPGLVNPRQADATVNPR